MFCDREPQNDRFFLFWEISLSVYWEGRRAGDYPRFKATYMHDELVEHLLLSAAERALVDSCRGDSKESVYGDYMDQVLWSILADDWKRRRRDAGAWGSSVIH